MNVALPLARCGADLHFGAVGAENLDFECVRQDDKLAHLQLCPARGHVLNIDRDFETAGQDNPTIRLQVGTVLAAFVWAFALF